MTIPSVSDGYGGSDVHIPESTGGYGGYGDNAAPTVRLPDSTAGYGGGYGQETGTVRLPGAASGSSSGYGGGAIHMPGFPEGPGTGSSGTVRIPGQAAGYGDGPSGTVRIPTDTRGYGETGARGYGDQSTGSVRIPTDTRGYGEASSGTVRIPSDTAGYGAGTSQSGTVRIPDVTTGYGASPSGTVAIPGQTEGYGAGGGTGTVRIPGATEGYGGSRTSPFDSGPVQTGTGPHQGDSQRYVIENVSIVDINTGRTIHLGTVDLLPTLERIRRGERADHRNDGAVFGNRERNLPRKPRGYYREYVVPTPGVRGVGPQRLVVGNGGEVYYTHDHYDSFQRIE